MKTKTNHDTPFTKKGVKKILLIMKLTLFLAFITVFQVSATNIFSQDKNVSLDMQNVTVRDVIREIELQIGMNFFYNDELSELNTMLNITMLDKPIQEALESTLDQANMTYEVIKDDFVVLLPARVPVQVEPIGITGTVTDENNEPLPGVNVVIKGSSTGTITDLNGKFSIKVEDSSAILVFSYVGYLIKEVTVGNQTTIDLAMQSDVLGLEEVIVVGYGSVKKSDLTGSVSSVSSEDLNIYPTSNVIQALQGRTSGVQIQSNNGGEPGGYYNILIRGASSINASNEPLYVVDGYPQGTLPPPEDVESIEILKDASATAIYGSRGANGVVIITTKKGRKGKMRVNFNSSFSTQKEIKRYDLLNALQYANLINEVDESNGNPPSFENPASLGVGIDWQDEILQTGNIQNYNLSLSGGADKVDYYVSGVYYDQKGIIINSDYNRYSLTSNVHIYPSEKVKIGLNIFGQRDEQNRLSTQEGTTGAVGGGVVSTALLFAPSSPIYNEDGSYTLHPLGIPFDNPVAIANERKSQRLADYLNTNITGEFELFEGFKYNTILGMRTVNGRNGNYQSSKLYHGGLAGGIAEVSSNKNSNFVAENYLTYTKNFGGVHALSIMGGYSYQVNTSEALGVTGTGFLTDAFDWWNLHGAANAEQPYTAYRKSELSSFYGRMNYTLLDRYLFTINSRYDGSSVFAVNNKWAYFPSGAFAWNVHKEDFLKDSRVFSELKLRASYGVSGNQAIRPYESLGKLRDVFTVINGEKVNAVRPISVTNNNLTWESTAQTDIGLDMGFFRNKLSLTVDYYNKVTSDLLFEVPLPEYTGYSSQLKNIGELENKGVEFMLEANNIGNALQWSSKFNVSLNRNKILKLPEGDDILYATAPGQFSIHSSQIMREGEPLGTFYGYVYEGVQQSGDELLDGAEGLGGERFKDLDGNGILNDLDRTIIGDPNPDFYWGWNNYFTYKNFELNIFFVGVHGNEMINYTRMGLDGTSGVYNATTDMLDRWTPTHTDTDVAKAANRPMFVSSRWVEDASYIRLENITVGYSFSKKILEKIKIRQLRIFVSAQSPLIFTNYKGFDPEVNWGSGNRNIGLDYGSYINTKSYTAGLNIGF